MKKITPRSQAEPIYWFGLVWLKAKSSQRKPLQAAAKWSQAKPSQAESHLGSPLCFEVSQKSFWKTFCFVVISWNSYENFFQSLQLHASVMCQWRLLQITSSWRSYQDLSCANIELILNRKSISPPLAKNSSTRIATRLDQSLCSTELQCIWQHTSMKYASRQFTWDNKSSSRFKRLVWSTATIQQHSSFSTWCFAMQWQDWSFKLFAVIFDPQAKVRCTKFI